jgi:hypothetical protein
VTEHIKAHQSHKSESQIENILEVRDECERSLGQRRSQILAKSESMKINWDQMALFNRCSGQIDQLYQQIVKIVDIYFQQIYDDLKK